MTGNPSRMMDTAATAALHVSAREASTLLRTLTESAPPPAGQHNAALRNLVVAADSPASQQAYLVAAHAWVPGV